MKEDTTPIDPTWISKTGGFAKDMTVRDHYAGLAMQGILTATLTPNTVWSQNEAAETAYKVADAMLEARKK